MARPIISDGQIREAARQLQAAGQVVTGWSLRRVLGAGRPDRLFAVWQAASTAGEPGGSGAAAAPTGDSARAALEHAAAAVRTTLAGLAEAVAAGVRAEAEQRRQADLAMAEAAAAAERAEAVDALEVADGEREWLREELEQQRQARLEAEACAAVAAQPVARLEAELTRLRAELEAARSEAAEARGRAAALSEERDRLLCERNPAREERDRLAAEPPPATPARPTRRAGPTAPAAEPEAQARATELARQGKGWRVIRRETGLSEWQARQILKDQRAKGPETG